MEPSPNGRRFRPECETYGGVVCPPDILGRSSSTGWTALPYILRISWSALDPLLGRLVDTPCISSTILLLGLRLAPCQGRRHLLRHLDMPWPVLFRPTGLQSWPKPSLSVGCRLRSSTQSHTSTQPAFLCWRYLQNENASGVRYIVGLGTDATAPYERHVGLWAF